MFATLRNRLTAYHTPTTYQRQQEIEPTTGNYPREHTPPEENKRILTNQPPKRANMTTTETNPEKEDK